MQSTFTFQKLLTVFSEYSTFVAALFCIFSFVTNQGFVSALMLFAEGLFLSGTMAKSLAAIFVFGPFILLVITGFLLSLYHPFSKRQVSATEARCMMFFASTVTLFMSLGVFMEALISLDVAHGVTLANLFFSIFYLAVSFATLRYLSEPSSTINQLWRNNQLTPQVAILILLLVIGIGVWGYVVGWQSSFAYQLMLTLALVIGTIVAKDTSSAKQTI